MPIMVYSGHRRAEKVPMRGKCSLDEPDYARRLAGGRHLTLRPLGVVSCPYGVRTMRSTTPRSQRCAGGSSTLRSQDIAVPTVGVAKSKGNTCPEIGAAMTASGDNFISSSIPASGPGCDRVGQTRQRISGVRKLMLQMH